MDKALIFAYRVCVCKGVTRLEILRVPQGIFKQQDSGNWQIRFCVLRRAAIAR